MNKCLIISILLLLYSITNFAQEATYATYDWNTFSTNKTNDSITSKNGALIKFERNVIEYFLNKENIFEEIQIYHSRIKVTSHDALDKYNKIYISLRNVLEVLNIKARFISPKGDIVEISKESIKKLENMENTGDFSIFAIEGAEVGGEIEYFYTLRKSFSGYYTYWTQNDVEKQNYEVIIKYPSNLEFITKCYNGFPDFVTKTDSSGYSIQRAFINYMPALEKEQYAFYKANLMRFEITLAYNNYNSSVRAYSWSKICSSLYSSYYLISNNEQKAVEKYYKTIEFDGTTQESRIRSIENKVKSEIAITDEVRSTDNLNEVLTLKQTNLPNATKLFIALFNISKINFELVYTSSKEDNPFDPDFNSWNFLDQLIIYFPDINKAMIPDKVPYRLGIIPNQYFGQFALFMHPLVLKKDLGTLSYEIKKLPEEPYQENADSMFVKLTLDPSLKINRNMKRVMYGSSAANFQSFFSSLNAEKQLEIVNTIFGVKDKNAQIEKFTVKNEKQNDIGFKPFEIEFSEKNEDLIEAAGSDIIIKVGETIGLQSELYQEKPRQQPIQISSLHSYYRKIEFTIPDGYKLRNPNELKIKEELSFDGKVSSAFYSDFEIKGNTLIITSSEFYGENYYPKSEYIRYKDVINAAANFNKCKVVLTKN